MTSPLLDRLPLTPRDKRAVHLLAQELHHHSHRVMLGLVKAGAVNDAELVTQAALARLLEVRMRTPVPVVGEAD